MIAGNVYTLIPIGAPVQYRKICDQKYTKYPAKIVESNSPKDYSIFDGHYYDQGLLEEFRAEDGGIQSGSVTENDLNNEQFKVSEVQSFSKVFYIYTHIT